MWTSNEIPVYEFDIRVALHQDKTAPVSQEWGKGRMWNPALDGTESTVTSGVVHMLWDRTETDRKQITVRKSSQFKT